MKVMLDEGAFLPTRAHPSDAGLDLYATESFWLHPGEHVVTDTGVHVEIPEGHVGLITSKSGLMSQGITSRGTIDSDYRGSIKAVLFNHGKEGIQISRGQKITQLVILPCVIEEVEQTFNMNMDTDRGTRGFGSSGK